MPQQHKHIIEILLQNVTDLSRPNLYEVELSRGPDFSDTGTNLSVTQNLIVSVQNPAVNLGNITIPRMGRKIEIPGSVSFENVNMTLYDDIDGITRGFIFDWQKNYFKDLPVGTLNTDMLSFIGGEVKIFQLDGNHNRKIETKLINAWPKTLGEIELNHETEDSLNTFSVTFAYDYLERNVL